LVPFTFILALEGAVLASRWAIRHRPTWTEEGAARLFLVVAVASVVVNAGAFTAMAMPGWDSTRDDRLAVGQALDALGAPQTDLVMSADPSGIEYFTGHGGVVTPTDTIDILHEVAVDYHIRWLVLERAYIVAPMVPVLEAKERPAWIGPPIFSLPYEGPQTGDPVLDGAPRLAIYAVCIRANDPRCATLAASSPAR
jgi:hypothetical protein